MLVMDRAACGLALLLLPLAASASGVACDSRGVAQMPVRPTLISTVAIELPGVTTQLGGATGVLAQSFDEALSVDNVLARIHYDGCRMASTSPVNPPVAASASLQPANYKPKTAFDNSPWRFNMTQNGKRMTADEFDAWMKARGVRVVGRKDAETPPAPAASDSSSK